MNPLIALLLGAATAGPVCLNPQASCSDECQDVSGTMTCAAPLSAATPVTVTGAAPTVTCASGNAITVKGQTSATAGPSVILDNATAATSGEILSVRSGGVEKASLDYGGNLACAGSATFSGGNITGSSSSPSLILQAPSTLSSGFILGLLNGGVGKLYFDFDGHAWPSLTVGQASQDAVTFTPGAAGSHAVTISAVGTDANEGLVYESQIGSGAGTSIQHEFINSSADTAGGDLIAAFYRDNASTLEASISIGGTIFANLGFQAGTDSTATAFTKTDKLLVSLTPAAIAASSCSDVAETMSGPIDNCACDVGVPAATLGSGTVTCYVSAAGTVQIHFCNVATASWTPPAGSYAIRTFCG